MRGSRGYAATAIRDCVHTKRWIKYIKSFKIIGARFLTV